MKLVLLTFSSNEIKTSSKIRFEFEFDFECEFERHQQAGRTVLRTTRPAKTRKIIGICIYYFVFLFCHTTVKDRCTKQFDLVVVVVAAAAAAVGK